MKLIFYLVQYVKSVLLYCLTKVGIILSIVFNLLELKIYWTTFHVNTCRYKLTLFPLTSVQYYIIWMYYKLVNEFLLMYI